MKLLVYEMCKMFAVAVELAIHGTKGVIHDAKPLIKNFELDYEISKHGRDRIRWREP